MSGDGWGLGLAPEERLGPVGRRTLDRAAELCEVGAERAELRSLYATAPGLAPPDTILHFEGGAREERLVRWRAEPLARTETAV